jgi:hypothetical protein
MPENDLPANVDAWTDDMFKALKLARTGEAASAEDVRRAEAFRNAWKSARNDWRAASEQIDSQISDLQAVLKGSDDPELAEIGQFGMNALTGNHRVKVMAAIMEIDGGDGLPPPKARAKITKALSALEAHVSSDRLVKAVDANPFQVKVAIAQTLATGATALKRALAVAAS